jgi:hypothetical protein
MGLDHLLAGSDPVLVEELDQHPTVARIGERDVAAGELGAEPEGRLGRRRRGEKADPGA